ncbi:MAG: DUF952 domain-containing protein [Anaerolineae bacterium]
MNHDPIYHLVPGVYYYAQPPGQPYLPAGYAAEGFIHCTGGVALLLQVANGYFADASGELLALQIDPRRLTAPLKFEPPIPPPGASPRPPDATDTLFPHIYGPLNREAITAVIPLQRDAAGRWRWPE